MGFDIYSARQKVKNALSATHDWRKVARDDFLFMQGKQWNDADLENMKKAGRPAITINRVRPVINLLCGYAAQNETEPDFLPRSEEDDRIARVAKGITKYTLDRANYQREKKKAFRDTIVCGLANYWVSYEFDFDKLDGLIRIDRISPFDVVVDPECLKEDLSDAQFICRYSWESPERLKQIYTDKSDEIDKLEHKYDDSEQEVETVNTLPLWWSKDFKKVRVVQYWYKEYSKRKVFMTANGVIDESKADIFNMLLLSGQQPQEIPETQIRYATFADDVLLEEGESPYKHKRFPLVRQYCYYTGENQEEELEPAGIVRDIKDAQRELNKNRSQRMHVVNQQALGVRFWSGQVDDKFKRTIEKNATKAGANIFIPQGISFQDGTPAMESSMNMNLEQQSSNDFYSISGITPESLSGSVGSMSGKAIDLRQSVTTVQTADIFDKAKEAERQIVQLLWGEQGRQGLIPQFYNQDKALRILGEDGEKEFVQIKPDLGQPMQEQLVTDPMGMPQMDEDGNPVTKVLYDLTLFDFDIIISTATASATARKASLYQLLEAKQAGADIPMDIIMEYMDIPNKESIKERLRKASEQPAMPEIKLSGGIDDLPAEALSTALQSIGVNISPEQILQERLALKGRAQPIQQPQPVNPMMLNQ